MQINKQEIQIEIEFRDIRKTFRNGNEKIEVLKGISGQVEKGSILTIIGPSGSGKSTILSLCNLMLTPDSGEIFIAGKEVREWDPQELRKYVGISFQSAPMIKGTVLHNLSLPYRLQGKQLDHPEKYLEEVGLGVEFLSREAKELSGGQKQRLSLARTLVNHPGILLLDEITSALDRHLSKEIEDLILEINKRRKTTILWVTHDLSQAERVGDQTWLIMDGELVEAGETENFFNEPKNERTKEFLMMKRDIS